MTKPTQEQIDDAIEAVKESVKEYERRFNKEAEHGEVVLAALEAYKPVAVEDLKKEDYSGKAWAVPKDFFNDALKIMSESKATGWNACIDHLVEKGIINGK